MTPCFLWCWRLLKFRRQTTLFAKSSKVYHPRRKQEGQASAKKIHERCKGATDALWTRKAQAPERSAMSCELFYLPRYSGSFLELIALMGGRQVSGLCAGGVVRCCLVGGNNSGDGRRARAIPRKSCLSFLGRTIAIRSAHDCVFPTDADAFVTQSLLAGLLPM